MTRYAPPSSEDVIAAARRLSMTLSNDAAAMFARYGAALEFAYRRVEALDEYLPQPRPGERTFTRPAPTDNRFGAVRRRVGDDHHVDVVDADLVVVAVGDLDRVGARHG